MAEAGSSKAIQPSNAQAGPSKAIYPALLDDRPRPRLASISGSDDLLDVYGLSSFYDRFVRAYPNAVSLGWDPKGKGRANKDQPPLERPAGVVRMEKHLTYLIKEIPGITRIPKDHRLRDLVQDPNIQPVDIRPIEDDALREAFTFLPGQLDGFDLATWSAIPHKGKKKKGKRLREISGESVDGPAIAGEELPGDGRHRDKRRKKEPGGYHDGL